MEWGDIATWVGAIGALGALIAAITAARQARQIYLLESERDRKAEESRLAELSDRKKRQASQISAWVSLRELPDLSDKGFLVILVRNASELPVYSVDLHVVDPSGQRLVSERLDVLPPTNTPLELPQVAVTEDRFSRDPSSTEGLVVQIDFRDSSGVQWTRNNEGALLENLTNSTSTPRAALKQSEDEGIVKAD